MRPGTGLVRLDRGGRGVNRRAAAAPVVTLLNIEDLYFVTAKPERAARGPICARASAPRSPCAPIPTPAQRDGGRHPAQAERTTDADARFVAYIRLDESELDLLPGMTGRVEVVTEEE